MSQLPIVPGSRIRALILGVSPANLEDRQNGLESATDLAFPMSPSFRAIFQGKGRVENIEETEVTHTIMRLIDAGFFEDTFEGFINHLVRKNQIKLPNGIQIGLWLAHDEVYENLATMDFGDEDIIPSYATCMNDARAWVDILHKQITAERMSQSNMDVALLFSGETSWMNNENWFARCVNAFKQRRCLPFTGRVIELLREGHTPAHPVIQDVVKEVVWIFRIKCAMEVLRRPWLPQMQNTQMDKPYWHVHQTLSNIRIRIIRRHIDQEKREEEFSI